MVDMIVTWISNALGEALNALVDFLMPLLGFDISIFNATFPFAGTSYVVFQRMALCIVLMVALVHLWPWFFPSNPQDKISPFRIAFLTVMAVFMIYYGNFILEEVINICAHPYNALLNLDATWDAEAMSFNGVSAVINDALFAVSIPLYILILLLIGIAFIKLLLEAVERYCILFVLMYLSPLASSTMASDSTRGIFKRYLSMFFAQCLLLILNVWSLKMVVSMFTNLDNVGAGSPMLAMFMGYAFLRIAAKMDSYLNQLGLNAAITGAGLGGELISAGMMLASKFGGRSAGSGSPTGGSTGGLPGFINSAKAAAARYSPISGAAVGMKNGAAAVFKTAGQAASAANQSFGEGGAIGAAIRNIRKTGGEVSGQKGITNTQWGAPKTGAISTAAGAARKAWNSNLGKNLHKAGMSTNEASLWSRELGRAGANYGEYLNDLTGKYAGQYDAPITDFDRENVAGYSHVADAAYTAAASSEIPQDDPQNVGAVLQGLGVEAVNDQAAEFVSVAYGNTEADGVNYSISSSGLQASYTKDGYVNSISVVKAAQYEQMAAEKQHGFERFRTADGQSYYVRCTRSQAQKPPTAAQAAETAFTASAAAFTQNPADNPMRGSDYAYMARTPKAVNQVFDGLHESNQSVTDYRQIAYALNSIKTTNIPSQDKNEAIMKLRSGDVDAASMNGDGLSVAYRADDGSPRQITILSQYGAKNYSDEYLENRKYGFHNSDGNSYYSLFEKGEDSK